MAANFVNIDRDSGFLLPPDMRDWIAEDDPVHFIIAATASLDTSLFKVNRRGSGSEQYPPQTLLALLIYCYTLGVFSSRKIERATHRDVAVRYLMAGHHPDRSTISTFRRVNEVAIKATFQKVLLMANKLGMLKVGRVSVDGTRIKADASMHKNVRYDRACALIKQIQADIDELMAKAAEADSRPPDDDDRLPKDLLRRERLLAKLEEAKQQMEEDAREHNRHEHEAFAKIQAERAEREAERESPIPGPKPKPPCPEDKAVPDTDRQINLTDSDSRLMTKRGETGQVFNAQAAVDADGSMLILSTTVVQGNDTGELKNVIYAIDPLVGRPTQVLADSGYKSVADIEALDAAGMDPHVAVGAGERRKYEFRPEPKKPKPPRRVTHPTLVAMQQKLETDEGRRNYRLRQQTVEPVFGIVKEQLGFRQFSLRGLEGVRLEWELVALAYNMKMLARRIAAA